MSWELSLPPRPPPNETPGKPWELVHALPPGSPMQMLSAELWSRRLMDEFDRGVLYSMLNQP